MNCFKFFTTFCFCIISCTLFAQQKNDDTTQYKIIAAGPEYAKPHFHEWLWGRNRRQEWITPVKVPILRIDESDLKLIPYKQGGGNESKTLRLKTPDGKEYTLHSINKSRTDVVLPAFKNTFVEDIIDDGISMSYPYGAFAMPKMEQAAGIYHSMPQLVYVPHQAALNTFDEKFGNDLYLLEQRLDGDWSNADNFGNFKNFSAPEKIVERMRHHNGIRTMQYEFIKARLFDILVSDWDRHEDNWRWGSKDTNENAVYYPIPRDRDQVFYTHNGFLIDKVLSATGLSYMQNFDDNVHDVPRLNYEEADMDRYFSNQMTKNDWINAARFLQNTLTDSVIQKSVAEVPEEIYKVSGKEIVSKLIARRNQLVKAATDYYLFIASAVDIPGSKGQEYFDVNKISPEQTVVKVYARDSLGLRSDSTFYSRTFNTSETKEIRLYGIDGQDVFHVNGDANKMLVRIIGGPAKDSIVENDGSKKIMVYDDHENVFETKKASLHLRNDSAIHAYEYASYNYNSSGFLASLFYDNPDRLFIGFGYGLKKYAWRRKPFATKQSIGVRYSFSQNAISVLYSAVYPNLFDNWNLNLSANFDAIRWTNFYGLGNETISSTDDRSYYRLRTREWYTSVGINKGFGKSTFAINAFFQSAKILNDTDRFVVKVFAPFDTDALESNNYAGLKFSYSYLSVDDSIVPVKGVSFLGNGNYILNTSRNEFFQKYSARIQIYLPLFNKFSLAIRNAAAAIIGNADIYNSAEFYEHVVLGGANDLRGFRRERFWGKTIFYNSNELRYITNLHTHLLNAKVGLLAFFDDGRVWIPSENPSAFHTAYGGGILIAPFKMVSATLTYGISDEARLIQVRLNKLF